MPVQMDTDLSEVTPGQKHTLEMGQAKDEAMDFGKSLLYTTLDQT